jgi:hypothetical protein
MRGNGIVLINLLKFVYSKPVLDTPQKSVLYTAQAFPIRSGLYRKILNGIRLPWR